MQDEQAAKEKYPIIYQVAQRMAKDDSNAYGLNSKGTKGNIN